MDDVMLTNAVISCLVSDRLDLRRRGQYTPSNQPRAHYQPRHITQSHFLNLVPYAHAIPKFASYYSSVNVTTCFRLLNTVI